MRTVKFSGPSPERPGFCMQYAALIALGAKAFGRRPSLIIRTSAGAALLLLAAPALSQTAPDLGSTSTYGIVSETFTNTTAGTTVDGDVCFATGPAINPAVTGTIISPCPAQTETDQNAARADLVAQSCTSIGAAVALDTISIGGGPPGQFPPGCYSSTGAMTITTGATVTLSGDGVYIFRPAGALSPAAGSSVVTADGACTNNVFWTPDGGTTIGANAAFVGTVFRGTAAGLSITLGDSASLEGRALAFGSTVTTANNAIAVPDQCLEEPGTLIVEKQTNPDGSLQSFTFTGDAAGDLTDNGQIVVDNLVPGDYSSTETIPAGWELTDIVCNDANSTGDIGTATANFVLDAGETVTCVFVNTELPPAEGSITILKQASPSDTGQSFNFSGDLGSFSLAHGEFIVETRAPGTYAVSETVPAGWQLDSATCNDGSPVNAIDLQAGENVTCTFSNSRLAGSIIVEKQTNPDGSPQSFTFTGDAAGNLTDGQRIVVGNLVPGNYSSTESVPLGWELTDIICNDTDSTGDIGTATANFVLDAGETVTCVFINTDLPPAEGAITILKQASPSNTGQSFDFSGDLGNFSLLHGEFIVVTRPPGAYGVSEAVPDGWRLDSATCNDGSPAGAIDLQAGENVTCTFSNSRLSGSIIVEKQTNPAGSLQSFTFTGDAAGELTDDQRIVVGNLVPGTYSSTESVPLGWELTDIVCNDADSTGDIGAATANFVLDADEVVICAFINTELTASDGVITILKLASTSNTGDSFGFSGDLGFFSLMHGEFIVETLPPGIYGVSETVPADWQLDSASCDDGSPVDAIDLEAGESVTCTFANSLLAAPFRVPVFSQRGIALIVLMMVIGAAVFVKPFDPNR